MQGKGFGGAGSLEREKNEGRGRKKKKKSEADALSNRNRGLFPTSLLLLALYPVQHLVSSSSFSFLFLRVECNSCTVMGPL